MVDRAKRMATIKSHIAILAQSEEEAQEILRGLMQEDWKHLTATIRSVDKWPDRPCIVCGAPHRCGNHYAAGLCPQCYPKHYCKTQELSRQVNRAKKMGLPATLTLREWYATKEYFQWGCAYCAWKSDEEYDTLIEHFIPVKLGGGTTKDNCVPACWTCNVRKRNRHPNDTAHLFARETIERISAYLQQFS